MDDWSLVFDRKKRNIWDLSRFIYLYSLLLFFILNFRTTILHRKICSRHFYVLSCVKYNTELQDNNKTSRATIVFWKRLQFVWPPTTALFRNQVRTLGMKLNEDSHMRLDQCSNAMILICHWIYLYRNVTLRPSRNYELSMFFLFVCIYKYYMCVQFLGGDRSSNCVIAVHITCDHTCPLSYFYQSVPREYQITIDIVNDQRLHNFQPVWY